MASLSDLNAELSSENYELLCTDVESQESDEARAWRSSSVIDTTTLASNARSSEWHSTDDHEQSSPICDIISQIINEDHEINMLSLNLDAPDDMSVMLGIAKEPWSIDEQTTRLLASIIATPVSSSLYESSGPLWSKIRTELPVLQHDHEVHMLKLWTRNNNIDKHEILIDSFSVEELDLIWSAAEHDSKAQLDVTLCHERLDVSQATKAYLSYLLQTWTATTDHLEVAMQKKASYNKLREDTPLLPLDPASKTIQTTFVSSSLDIEMLELTDTLEDDHIMQQMSGMVSEPLQDGDIPPDTSVHAVASTGLPQTLDSLPHISPYFRKPNMVARITSPLLPLSSSSNLPAIPSTPLCQQSALVDVFTIEAASQETHDFAQLEETFRPQIDAVLSKLHDEQLDELDTVLRLPVPRLDDASLPLVWHRYYNAAHMATQTDSLWVASLTERELRWSGSSKLERSMQWMPFDRSCAYVNLDEDIDDSDLSLFTCSPEQDDSARLKVLLKVKRREWHKLAVGVDDIQPIVHTDSEDIMLSNVIADVSHLPSRSTVIILDKSRYKALPQSTSRDDVNRTAIQMYSKTTDAAVGQKRMASPTIGQVQITDLVRKRMRNHKAQSSAQHQQESSSLALLHSDLNSFLHLNGSPVLTRQRLVEPSRQQMGANDVSARMQHCSAAQHELSKTEQQFSKAVPMQSNNADQPSSKPVLIMPAQTAYQIIVSSDIITRGNLIRGLERCLPKLQMIERSTTVSQPWTPASKVQRDADITISATTGLMLTTLQKLKQRPLPGQAVESPFRTRLLEVAARYNKLLVLVSEGAVYVGDQAQTLQDHDCDAIADFIAWTSSIETCIAVIFVAGGEEELANWICGYIQQHHAASVELSHEETRCEHILRLFGFNAIAAQTISADLRFSAEQGCHGPSGLARLLTMTGHQRHARYSSMLGDTGALARLSHSIDKGWFK